MKGPHHYPKNEYSYEVGSMVVYYRLDLNKGHVRYSDHTCT